MVDDDREIDDLIAEAIYDAACDGEGRATAEHLRHHLAKRGLKIIRQNYVDRLRELVTQALAAVNGDRAE